MPDPVLHSVFGNTVKGRLSPEARNALVPEPYSFAQFGPDPWFGYKPWVRVGRGRIMHTARTGEFLMALADQAKNGKSRAEMFSYLAGFLCHYALDGKADVIILPVWDICGYKETARINFPGTINEKNWTWKLKNLKQIEKDMDKVKAWIQQAER